MILFTSWNHLNFCIKPSRGNAHFLLLQHLWLEKDHIKEILISKSKQIYSFTARFCFVLCFYYDCFFQSGITIHKTLKEFSFIFQIKGYEVQPLYWSGILNLLLKRLSTIICKTYYCLTGRSNHRSQALKSLKGIYWITMAYE